MLKKYLTSSNTTPKPRNKRAHQKQNHVRIDVDEPRRRVKGYGVSKAPFKSNKHRTRDIKKEESFLLNHTNGINGRPRSKGSFH